MNKEAQFRNAVVGGFNKADVLSYIETLQTEALTSRQKVDQQDTLVPQLRRQVQELEEELAAQRVQNREFNRVNEDYVRRILALSQEKDDLETRMKNLEADCEKLKDVEGQVGALILDALLYSEKIIQHAKDASRAVAVDAKATIRSSAQEVDSLGGDIGKMSLEFSDTLSALASKINALSGDLSNVADQLDMQDEADEEQFQFDDAGHPVLRAALDMKRREEMEAQAALDLGSALPVEPPPVQPMPQPLPVEPPPVQPMPQPLPVEPPQAEQIVEQIPEREEEEDLVELEIDDTEEPETAEPTGLPIQRAVIPQETSLEPERPEEVIVWQAELPPEVPETQIEAPEDEDGESPDEMLAKRLEELQGEPVEPAEKVPPEPEPAGEEVPAEVEDIPPPAAEPVVVKQADPVDYQAIESELLNLGPTEALQFLRAQFNQQEEGAPPVVIDDEIGHENGAQPQIFPSMRSRRAEETASDE